MHYEELSPPPELAPLVRCLWRLTGDGAPASEPGHAEPALPDGSPELIFALGDPFEQVGNGGTVTRQPRAFLVGQITGPMTVRPTGRIDLLAVRFESHGASVLHPMLRQLTDRWIDVTQLEHPALHSLGPALAATTAPAERLALVQLALRRIAERSHRPDARVALAVRTIRARHGAVTLESLAQAASIAPRTLQRLFAAQVGISPKFLARIVRFQRVFTAWRHDPGSLARVAAECGYFDQPHLVRDFRELAGMPPATLLAALPPFTGLFLP